MCVLSAINTRPSILPGGALSKARLALKVAFFLISHSTFSHPSLSLAEDHVTFQFSLSKAPYGMFK